MCGPVLAWDWFVLDVSWVLLVIGGAAVLRARSATPPMWLLFGFIAAGVGAFVISGTYIVQAASAEAAASTSAAQMLSGC